MVHAFLSDFLQNRICCTSQCPEQCFYGHELDLPLPLLSRGPQTSHGIWYICLSVRFSSKSHMLYFSVPRTMFLWVRTRSAPAPAIQWSSNIVWDVRSISVVVY